MAYARSRSMNADLAEGMSDGKFKKVVTDRGGNSIDRLTYETRRSLNDHWFGIHESSVKELPDGTRSAPTPDYFPTPVPEIF